MVGKTSWGEPLNSRLVLWRVPTLCSRGQVLGSEDSGWTVERDSHRHKDTHTHCKVGAPGNPCPAQHSTAGWTLRCSFSLVSPSPRWEQTPPALWVQFKATQVERTQSDASSLPIPSSEFCSWYLGAWFSLADWES